MSRRWVQIKRESCSRHHGVHLMPTEHRTSRTSTHCSPQGKMYHSKAVEAFPVKSLSWDTKPSDWLSAKRPKNNICQYLCLPLREESVFNRLLESIQAVWINAISKHKVAIISGEMQWLANRPFPCHFTIRTELYIALLRAQIVVQLIDVINILSLFLHWWL